MKNCSRNKQVVVKRRMKHFHRLAHSQDSPRVLQKPANARVMYVHSRRGALEFLDKFLVFEKIIHKLLQMWISNFVNFFSHKIKHFINVLISNIHKIFVFIFSGIRFPDSPAVGVDIYPHLVVEHLGDALCEYYITAFKAAVNLVDFLRIFASKISQFNFTRLVGEPYNKHVTLLIFLGLVLVLYRKKTLNFFPAF